jgi:hypothetical protein
MAKTENECKTAFCKDLRETGGFARRIEDQYGVGVPDMLCVPRGGPVFLIEAKIARTSTWRATDRQGIELKRFQDAVAASGAGYACEMAFYPEDKLMTIRQFGVANVDLWWNFKFPYWTSMGAEKFLQQAHQHWSKNNGR